MSVVGEDGALDRERVVGGNGANACDFVGGDSNAEAGAADEDGAISFAVCYLMDGVSVVRVQDNIQCIGGMLSSDVRFKVSQLGQKGSGVKVIYDMSNLEFAILIRRKDIPFVLQPQRNVDRQWYRCL